VPGSVPLSLSTESGATVQVKTADGQIATAQLVTVPSSSIQSIVQQQPVAATSENSSSVPRYI